LTVWIERFEALSALEPQTRDALVARGVTADRIQVGDPARGRPGVVFRFTAAETQATTPVAAPAEPDQAEPSGS